MLTRQSFLALPAKQQEIIARRMFANLVNTYRSFNPLGGESDDIWMCALLPGQEVLALDGGRFVLWDTGNRILAVCSGNHAENENTYYPRAVAVAS